MISISGLRSLSIGGAYDGGGSGFAVSLCTCCAEQAESVSKLTSRNPRRGAFQYMPLYCSQNIRLRTCEERVLGVEYKKGDTLLKTRLAFLLSVPLLFPSLARADDSTPNSVQPPAATPVDKHAELKDQAPSDAKDVPKPVFEAKKKFAEEKRALDQQVKNAIVQFGQNSPQAEQARKDAKMRLSELRQDIRRAQQQKK